MVVLQEPAPVENCFTGDGSAADGVWRRGEEDSAAGAIEKWLMEDVVGDGSAADGVERMGE